MSPTDDLEISRRRLLGTGVAAGAGLVLGAAGPPSAEARATDPRKPKKRKGAHRPRRADVVVVGAGAAGCAAAHAVAKAGRSVILVEARDRVGGRTENHDIGDGKIVEVGGTFVGPTQDRVLALLSEYGRGTFKTYDTGRTTTRISGHDGKIVNTDPLTYIPAFGPVAAVEFATVLVALDQMAKQIPTSAPWTAPSAGEWDGQTFQTWLDQYVHSGVGQRALAAFSSAVWGAPPPEISLLYAISYIAAAGNEHSPGNTNNLIATTGGAQEQRVLGGTQALFQDVAASLPGRVVLSSPVRRIGQDGNRVTIVSDTGTFSAAQVIVAVAPALAGRIFYDPGLPALRDQLTQQMPMGSYAKVECFYDKPFWREDGLNGQVFTDELVGVSWDQSPPDGSPGIIAAFIVGPQARWWDMQSPSARKQAVIDALSTLFGAQAAKPYDYFEKRWTATEVWSRGDPVGHAPPGVLTAFGSALREPCGQIKWASTESADYWIGYIEGAIRAGQRAAAQVLDDL